MGGISAAGGSAGFGLGGTIFGGCTSGSMSIGLKCGSSITGTPMSNVTGGACGIATCGRSIEALISGTTISRISMKSERFTAGQLWIERNRRREGPPVVYTVLSGKSARPFTDPKAILKWVKWPKGTPTGDALREWLASFDQKPQAPAPELDMAKIKAEGFGPEAHDDDPTANTKMVT